MSNDLIDLARIKIGKFRLQKEYFSLKLLIEECCTMFQILASKKNIKLESAFDSDLPLVIYHDKDRIKQILINLLSNAFKFT